MNTSSDSASAAELAVAPGPARRRPLAMLREAIRGSSVDFTSVPIGQGIFMLAVPMVLEMLMESTTWRCWDR